MLRQGIIMKYKMQIPPPKAFLHALKPFEIILFVAVIFVICTGWYISYHYKSTLRQAVISSYQETQLEIVRSVARAAELYISDEYSKGTDVSIIEQNILKRFIVPIHLLKNGDAWIYTPDRVVFDLSSDFPDEYRNKSMAEIFAQQVLSGASHYEEMSADVMQAREGTGWYIWQPAKGPEIAAWTPVRFENQVWTIGLSTPLFEILEATHIDDQEAFIAKTLIFVTIFCVLLLIFIVLSKSRRLSLETETYETKARLKALIDAIPDVIYFKNKDGRYLLVNTAFEEIFEKDREAILGHLDAELFTTEQSKLCRSSDEIVITEQKPFHAEERFLNSNGDTRIYKTDKVPLFNNKHKFIGLVGVSRDISESKRNEEALEKRIVALTRALDDVESVTFEDLFNIDDIQRLQEEFSQATGIASIITKPDGRPITKPSNFCRFCDIIRNTDKGGENCLKSDAILGRYNPDRPTIQPCLSGGLWDACAPITIGGKHIATWLVGQVRDETQSEEKICHYAQQIGTDEEALVEAFREVPAMAKDQFEKIAQALFTLAKQLSTSAYQNIQQARFITEKKSIEETLRTSTERYKALTELLPVGVIETDKDGNILFANQATYQLTGYDDRDLADGCKFQSMIAAEDLEKVNDMMQQVLADKPANGQEFQILRKDSSSFTGFINLSLYIIKSEQRLIGYIFDLTKLKEKDNALRESEEKLARSKKMESLGLLAGGVAHDLNNILSGIVSYPELLLLEIPETSPLHKPMETIKKSGEKAVNIVQDLLTMARRGVMVTEVIDLNATIREQLDSPEMEKLRHFHPQVEVRTQLDSKQLHIKGSSIHIAKTIMNLISNAAEAMPEGGILSIETGLAHIATPLSSYEIIDKGDYAVLTVSDTGIGMTQQDSEKIFEPFYTKKKMGKSGTGLGMAVVWGTVKDHHGFIDLKSEQGTGTTFTLYLPITLDEKQEAPPKEAVRCYGNGEKILIVDDVAEQREIASAILKELRYNVISSRSGEDAIEFLHNNDVDLVVLDMIMEPGIDGATTYRRIHEFKPHQKAIIASGFAITAQVDELRRLGIDRYINKPYSIGQIGKAVKTALADPQVKS